MPKSLRLAVLRDVEFMHILSECGNNEGWALAEDVSRKLKLPSDSGNQSVGSRCSWLRRYGLAEKTVTDVEGRQRVMWRLSDMGESLISNSRRDIPAMLRKLPESDRIALLDVIVATLPKGRREVAHFGRRTFTHYMGTYRDPKLFR